MRRPLAAIAALALALTIIAGCRPAGPPPPPPGGLRQVVLDAGWGNASPAVQDRVLNVIIPRESGWDPCAFYPGQSNCAAQPGSNVAKGLFELKGHDDLIHQACPFQYPLPWQDPHCNALAAWFLSGGGNLAPWGGEKASRRPRRHGANDDGWQSHDPFEGFNSLSSRRLCRHGDSPGSLFGGARGFFASRAGTRCPANGAPEESHAPPASRPASNGGSDRRNGE